MSLALVLGGGGVVGGAWETGLLKGLRDLGTDLTGADLIVGTSADAVVGAVTASERLDAFYEWQRAPSIPLSSAPQCWTSESSPMPSVEAAP